MLKKTITYENFDGDEVTGDFFFNMTKAELVEFTASLPGNDIEAYLTQLAVSNDKAAMLRFLKDLIARSYGKRVGDDFTKHEEFTNSFLVSEAYSELLFSMAENLDTAIAFFNGIMPKSLMKQISQEEVKQKAESLVAPKPNDISTANAAAVRAEEEHAELRRVQELEAELKRLKGE